MSPLFLRFGGTASVQVISATLMQTQTNTAANSLAEYRHRLGFTQDEVAQLLGYNRPKAVWKLESGRSVPSLPTALKLSAIYRAPVEFLFSEQYASLRKEIREREARTKIEARQSAIKLTPI